MSDIDHIARMAASVIADSSQGSDSEHGLSDASCLLRAELRSRDAGMLAGSAWFDALLTSADPNAQIDWALDDGQRLRAGMTLVSLQTRASALAQSQAMIDVLALMCGIAGATHEYVERVKGTQTDICLARHTLPGLRELQIAAAQCAGALINDNMLQLNAIHCATAGSVAAAVAHARQAQADRPTDAQTHAGISLDVTSLELLEAGLEAGVDSVVLVGLASHVLARAVNMADAHRRRFRRDLRIEATGDITLANIREIADTGVDRISVPALTNQLRTPLFDLVLI